MDMEFLKWIGHASFMLEVGAKKVYIDPFRLPAHSPRADVILITHPHPDHLSMDDISKIADSDTEIFVPHDSIDKLKIGKTSGVEPNKSYSSSAVRFSTIPAYNVVTERLDKHPKGNRWVGYIVEANGMTVYHAGDTDFIPEMEKIDVDLALIPMSGTYTMDPDQAIEAANKIKAKAVAPMHYKAVLGKERSMEAEEKFRKNVKNGVLLKEIHEPFFGF